MEPLVITVASTNVKWTKHDSPYLPETPGDIAKDILQAYEEGAAVAHIHGRDEGGKVTFDPWYYRKIVEEVQRHSDMIIQISTGGPPAPVEEKLAPIRELLPEMASLNIRGTQEEIEHTATVIRELKVVPVVEAFDVGMIEKANELIRREIIDKPPHVELVFGLEHDLNRGVLEDFDEMSKRIRALWPGSIWSRNRGAHNQFALDTQTIVLGGHIRVGLEDNLFLSRDELARNSAQFVITVKELCRALNRKVATVKEARRLFHLPR